MISLTIQNLKNFMSCLLTTATFDHFLVPEAVIRTDAVFTVDGHLSEGFYTAEELSEKGFTEKEPLPFGALRPTFYALIRGTHTPVAFRFVLMLSPENQQNVLTASESGFSVQDVSGIFLNLRYQDGLLTCTTAISYRTFSPNHDLDRAWDNYARKFLTKQGIVFEENG